MDTKEVAMTKKNIDRLMICDRQSEKEKRNLNVIKNKFFITILF